MARAGDGRIYFGSGPKGVIYRLDSGKVTEFCTLPDGGNVLSLLFTKTAGCSPARAADPRRRSTSSTATVRPAFSTNRHMQHISGHGPRNGRRDLRRNGQQGPVVQDRGRRVQEPVLADLKPKNLICLAYAPDGFLYTGTDEDGLVCRINPADGTVFVMYDAKEPEISAIVFDGQGNLYASTADADGARPGRSIADKPGGKPDPTATQLAGGRLRSISKDRSQPLPPRGPERHDHRALLETGRSRQTASDAGPEDGDSEPAPTTRQSSFTSRIGRPIGGALQAANRAAMPYTALIQRALSPRCSASPS